MRRFLLASAVTLAACSGARTGGGGGDALLPVWAALAPTVYGAEPIEADVPPATASDPATCHSRYSQWLNGFGTRDVAYDLCLRTSLGALAQRSGLNVWTSGPHRIADDGTLTPQIYLASPEAGTPAFGHYNPAFVTWAADTVIPQSPALRAATQPVYDARFRRLARVFWTARQRGDTPEAQAAASLYRAYLDTGEIGEHSDYQNGFTMNVFRDAAEPWARGYQETGNDWEALYEAQTAFGFWVRRERDGTADRFESGLREMLAAYDAGWLASHEG